MGRSRGGLTTKLHALVDANGLPIAFKLTPGHAHDGRSTQDMLTSVGTGDILLADRAYDSDALRQSLERRGAWGNIALMPNRKRRPPFRPGSIASATPSSASSTKHFRAAATRYDKRDDNFLGTIKLASVRFWLRAYESMT